MNVVGHSTTGGQATSATRSLRLKTHWHWHSQWHTFTAVFASATQPANLIVLDEFGYEPLDRASANLLFRVINYRYGKGGAIAITTNKGVAGWPAILADDEVLAGAILDRLLHNATVLNIQGRSYRLKELDAQLQQQSVTRSRSSPEVSGRDVEVEGGGKSNAAGPSTDAHQPPKEATTKI